MVRVYRCLIRKVVRPYYRNRADRVLITVGPATLLPNQLFHHALRQGTVGKQGIIAACVRQLIMPPFVAVIFETRTNHDAQKQQTVGLGVF